MSGTKATQFEARVREAVLVTGTVQGVGFRPAVYRLANRRGLGGWVQNTASGARLELEGPPGSIEAFLRELPQALPGGAALLGLTRTQIAPRGEVGFAIEASERGPGSEPALQADLATCSACLAEARDPTDRRARYPFVACAECGPRYSIATGAPYDRAHTTLARFPLCAACRAEYRDPGDRRFHAQATGCAACGPRLIAEDPAGLEVEGDAALRRAVEVLAQGGRVALKGLGGYQLLADARCAAAVCALRALKRRPAKPLAVMVADLAAARAVANPSEAEATLLASPEAPIVLVRGRAGAVCAEVAPNSPYLGVLLPTTALHALLLDDFGGPLVVTSGNLSGAPIVIDDAEARAQLGPGVDLLLRHDRPIAHAVDDSVAQVVCGRTQLLRRARGYVPRPLRSDLALPPLLAAGGQQKVTLARSSSAGVRLSPHLGDLDGGAAWARYLATRDALLADGPAPRAVACDLHPDYRTARACVSGELPRIGVQHHEAHVLAAAGEHGLEPPFLGVAWDGAGWGHDGTVWGGEFLRVEARTVRRVAHLQRFRLAGGDAAARDPRRSALGLLHAAGLEPPRGWLEASFGEAERRVLLRMLAREVRSPWTSSVGRLFDGVAALLGLGARASFEGEVAMRLQFAAEATLEAAAPLPFTLEAPAGAALLRWDEALRELLSELARGSSPGALAARFHAGLIEGILRVAEREQLPVVLGGGCFQNRLLLEGAVARLGARGFEVHWPQAVPPNDGGLAFGQLLGAARTLGGE